jgi:hypothetical protein
MATSPRYAQKSLADGGALSVEVPLQDNVLRNFVQETLKSLEW